MFVYVLSNSLKFKSYVYIILSGQSNQQHYQGISYFIQANVRYKGAKMSMDDDKYTATECIAESTISTVLNETEDGYQEPGMNDYKQSYMKLQHQSYNTATS